MIDESLESTNYPELATDTEAESAPANDQPVRVVPSDWNVATLRDKFLKGKIDVQPSYQRTYVWDQYPELKSRLIESLLLEIPIPPIYFAKMDGGRLEVIDGQQRLTTLIKFMNGEFPLSRLQRKSSLNGKKFAELNDDDQEKIHDSQIRSIVIDTGSNADLRYEVFERLNRGSVALKEQEIRNCVYRGPFNDLLAELEKSPEWRKVRGTAEPEPRFVEREMILRFFAFANRLDHYRGSLKPFLNEYMGNHGPKTDRALAEEAEKFRLAMRNVYQVFGAHSGHLYSTGPEVSPTVDGRWDAKFSISALDIHASALIAQSPAAVDAAAEQIREAYIFYLLTNPQVRLAISRRPAGKEATFVRWRVFRGQVQEILSGNQAEPRFFGYEYRKALWDTGHACQICHNEIHTFDDCTVDHIHPWARGGKTTPDNGQLAHRSCNARKCANVADVPIPDTWIEPSTEPSVAERTAGQTPPSFRGSLVSPTPRQNGSDDEGMPQSAYYQPILRALVAMGGKGTIGEVLDGRVLIEVRHMLTPRDFEPPESRPDDVHWRNTAQWARNDLVKGGLMKRGSPRGIWEITEAGRRMVMANGEGLSDAD